MKIRIFLIVFCAFFLSIPSSRSEETNSSVWLGFPILGRDQQPAEINLTKDKSLGSAFLLQLQRQALLLAARDELGVHTFDEFMGETAPNGAVKIDNIKTFPCTDISYTDHLQFLTELEKRSRNEFVAELKKHGVKKNEINKPENSLTNKEYVKEESVQIEKLLNEWALIPQFEAVRRTHRLIRQTGETPELLTFLVRGYTQLQMFTNIDPLDTHRVFQARAMLYAQRTVAQYGETSEYLSLRAAAWSLNNFHRLARQDFAEISEQKQKTTEQNISEQKQHVWINFAECYAKFDFTGLEKQIETADPKTEQPLGKLLRFFLLDYAYEKSTLARPYGKTIIADLPDCSRLYLGLLDINDFDMVYAPDGSLFHEHLARRITPAIQEMEMLPDKVLEAARKLRATVKKSSGINLFSGLFSGNTVTSQHFPLEQYYRDLAVLLNTLSAATSEMPEQEYSEPSLSMLSFILKDNEFHGTAKLAYGLQGHNGNAEEYIMPAMPVIGDHPDVEFLGLACRDRSLGTPFWHRLTTKIVPYNLFSQKSIGFRTPFSDTDFHGRIYSPYYITHLFADRENIRDMLYYHGSARLEAGDGKYYFVVDLLYRLCPNNPFAARVVLVRGKNATEEMAETIKKEFGSFPETNTSLAEFYQKKKQPDKIIDLIKDDYTNKLTQYIQESLVSLYLFRNEPEKAIDILKKFLETKESNKSLLRYSIQQKIGFILLQEGKIKEAESYFVPAMQTHSSWGLTGMAQYCEITGNFDDAEELFRADLQSYPENRYGELWGFLYRTNNSEQKKIMDEILNRYTRYKSANPLDTETLMKNIITNKEVIFPCYCADIPFPPPMGTDPLTDELLRDGNGYLGMIAWLDAMKKNDKKQADRLLLYLRELWFLCDKNDPFVAMQRNVLPKLKQRRYVDLYVRMLAALFVADQKMQKPNSFRDDEIDFVIRTAFVDDLRSYNTAAFLCFAIGRYKDLYGEKEQAIDYYRRVLGFRVRFDCYVRSLAVKELRKNGLTDKEYIKWSQADPKVRKSNISYTSADIFCRQLFRDYSDSPSGSVLAKPPSEKLISSTDFGKTVPLKSGWYQVTKILFRGHLIADEKDSEKVSVVYWRIPKEADKDDSQWGDIGIAHDGNYETFLQNRRDDGLYPVRLGVSGDSMLPALASFHDNDQMVLVLSINPNEEPKNMTSEPDSDCVRIEMKKVADIPVTEPLFPTGADQTSTTGTLTTKKPATEIQDIIALKNGDNISGWFNVIHYAAMATAGIALVLALVISAIKKKRRIIKETKTDAEN
jgi:tetratricopeptide (TPR) repeat protein